VEFTKLPAWERFYVAIPRNRGFTYYTAKNYDAAAVDADLDSFKTPIKMGEKEAKPAEPTDEIAQERQRTGVTFMGTRTMVVGTMRSGLSWLPKIFPIECFPIELTVS